MKIPVTTDNIKLFECLSSETRIKILEILGEGQKNIGELANLLNISSAITTRHIAQLEVSGLVSVKTIPGKRGLQKVCSLAADEIVLSFQKQHSELGYCQTISIPVGHFTSYDVTPTCGLASVNGFIGVNDDSRYFSSPDRSTASLIWFQTGWVEYKIPSYVVSAKSIKAIEISMEICSEFPMYKEDWPSDIHFYINDRLIGIWTSPGDFGSTKGAYTPDWWRAGTQYGLLKTICITNDGSMLDGIHLSDISLDQIGLQQGKDLSFKIAVPSDARNPGGVNIFGRGFGNYNQDIEVRVEYE